MKARLRNSKENWISGLRRRLKKTRCSFSYGAFVRSPVCVSVLVCVCVCVCVCVWFVVTFVCVFAGLSVWLLVCLSVLFVCLFAAVCDALRDNASHIFANELHGTDEASPIVANVSIRIPLPSLVILTFALGAGARVPSEDGRSRQR